jgi:seryl-tRNA(Sec) selenium transferase
MSSSAGTIPTPIGGQERQGWMVWFVMMKFVSTLLEWVRLGRKSEAEKTLEILLLRRQLAIVERTLDQPIRPSRGEKLTLAVLTTKLKAGTGRTAKELGEIIRIVQPETVLKWHRELVRRKWTQQKKNLAGRPRTAREIERLGCLIRECKLIPNEPLGSAETTHTGGLTPKQGHRNGWA